MKKVAVLTTFAALVATSSFAQAEVLTWDCRFTTSVTAEGVSQEQMSILFKVDTISRKAIMQGNAGLVDLDFHFGNEAISLTEKVASGVVQTTTITWEGLAVHSRNTVILSEIVAAQHFGKCLRS